MEDNKLTINQATFEENLNKLKDRLLDENQVGGAWFYGSEERFEEWAGDVLYEALEIFLNLCGVKIE